MIPTISTESAEKESERITYYGGEEFKSIDLVIWPFTQINIYDTLSLKHRWREGLATIKYGTHLIRFHFPLPVDIYIAEDKYVVENSSFNIYGVGRSIKDAINDFSECFIEIYLSYKNTVSTNLHSSAKKLLRQFDQVIAKHEDIS